MEIYQAPVQQSFVIVANAIAQSRTLTLPEIGLLTHLMSLPPGAHWTADGYADESATGRGMVRKARAGLEAAGHIVYAVTRVPDGPKAGSLRTVMTVHPVPVAPGERSVGRTPWTKPQVAPTAGNPAVGATCDDAPNPQVAPTAGLPAAGPPAAGNPAVLVKTFQKTKTSSPNPSAAAQRAAVVEEELAAAEDAPPETRRELLDLVASADQEARERVASPEVTATLEALLVDPRTARRELLDLIAQRLAAGWTPAGLAEMALSEPLPPAVRSRAALLASRIAKGATAPQGAAQRRSVPTTRWATAWCTTCDGRHSRRTLDEGAPCPLCHVPLVDDVEPTKSAQEAPSAVVADLGERREAVRGAAAARAALRRRP